MHDVTNCKCVLNVELDNPLSKMTKKFGIYLQTNVFLSGDHLIVVYSMPEDSNKSREKDIFLSQFGAEKLDNIWSIRQEPEDRATESFFRELIEVKSVVFDDVSLDKGTYRLVFRFNKNDQREVSRVLLKGLKQLRGLSIEYLGKSPNLLCTFKEIDRNFPLSYVEIKSTLPESEIERKREMPLGRSWAREIKMRTVDKGLKAVYHVHDEEKAVDESRVSVISSEDRIYGYISENSLLNHWSRELYENSITIMWMFQNFKLPEFDTAFVLPRFFIPQFLKIIESSIKRFPDWKISMRLLQDVKDIESGS